MLCYTENDSASRHEIFNAVKNRTESTSHLVIWAHLKT
uniref:Uncharacterized protein n=1 Tax=Anguilla anguilla TaxID=7936 RepID=A0A0E9PWY4_ANGAN